VQRRREWPTRVTQGLQILVQRRVITRVLGSGATRIDPPRLLTLLAGIPLMRRLPARLVGVGVRAEHVRTPTVAPGGGQLRVSGA